MTMNLSTLRDVRCRALTLGEFPWTEDFVRLVEDVEEAIAVSGGDDVASLTQTIASLDKNRALVQSLRKAVSLLTPKRRVEFVASPEADAYADAL